MAKQNADKLVIKLFAGALAMFAFGFALIPLYDVFCDIAGINGKTADAAYEAVEVQVDTSRTVTIQFVAENNDGMVWDFKPEVTSIKVHPGQATNTTFFASNPTPRNMVAQAIPSVSPGRAAEFFHKTECFCFNKQELAGRSDIDMPLQFIVDQDLPDDIQTITLAYTIFDVTPQPDDAQVAAQ
ncbi:MAG: cytochrome c oxidase assembly protein [Pseudomonadales bacterium]|nr:cytochrome c oxidase assembly protein [Pseudomonadales bacterium]